MRAPFALKLLPAYCSFLLSINVAPPVDGLKAFYDYRTGSDFGSGNNCGEFRSVLFSWLKSRTNPSLDDDSLVYCL